MHDVLLARRSVLRDRGQVSQVDQQVVRPGLDILLEALTCPRDADAIRWAEEIMAQIDRRHPVKPAQQERRVT